MSSLLAPIQEYVLDPIHNIGSEISDDLSTANNWIGLQVRNMTGNEKAATVAKVFTSVIVVALPYFLLPWQVVIGVMAAYELSKLKSSSFEMNMCMTTFLDMGRQLYFFMMKNMAKQAGAVAHIGTAAGTGVIAFALLIQSSMA